MKLFPSLLSIVFALIIYIHSFEEVNSLYVEGFPLISLVETVNFWASQQGVLLLNAIDFLCLLGKMQMFIIQIWRNGF